MGQNKRRLIDMGKKITQEEFVRRVAEILGPDYKVLG